MRNLAILTEELSKGEVLTNVLTGLVFVYEIQTKVTSPENKFCSF